MIECTVQYHIVNRKSKYVHYYFRKRVTQLINIDNDAFYVEDYWDEV